MNVENIEAFVYINHYGSFNKAAEVLFLSQPSVTARIQSLERELGCKLFDRLGKQIVLTDEGRKFLPYAQQVLQVLQKGRQKIQQRRTTPEALRLGSTVSVSNYVIPDFLPRIKATYPEVNIKLTTATTDQLIAKLLGQEIDLAFVRKVMHPAIRTVAYYEDPIQLYVYKDHPFIERGHVSMEALREQQLVFFECGSLDWLRIHRAFDSLEHSPDITYHVDNSETAKKLVMQGAGIAFLPGLTVKKEVQRQELFPIQVHEVAGVSLQISVVTLKEEYSPFAEPFGEMLRQL
ncbi:LysR family transcriptional regulator [Paenibacillus silvae]|uniref:HTH-type transcriptional regulator CitR n=1 Tax=Paenibacillus silvae TaxID=1325358 RepID=A0A2W6NL69_9BACL|nr:MULTISPECIES: LysR family transcriptional regulator [Paenibacillus]PZT56564.1 LysR family transcriptional regulator [Paenibacillus silvae]GGH61764.1 HTH-type transcriptional regulator CitR [Paenibacillus silvae]